MRSNLRHCLDLFSSNRPPKVSSTPSPVSHRFTQLTVVQPKDGKSCADDSQKQNERAEEEEQTGPHVRRVGVGDEGDDREGTNDHGYRAIDLLIHPLARFLSKREGRGRGGLEALQKAQEGSASA